MSQSTFSWDLFNAMPLVGILRNVTEDDVHFILPIFKEAGFTTLEVTLNTPGALSMISALASQNNGTLNIGAGTVCSMSDLDEALIAGASFIVTPIVKKEVIKKCVDKGIPIFPGALSPTEIFEAWNLGASMVKLYPASAVGAAYVSAILAPMPTIKIMPTGGIHISNMLAFMKSGSAALGIGSELFDKKIIQNRDKEALLNHFKLFTQQMQLSK